MTDNTQMLKTLLNVVGVSHIGLGMVGLAGDPGMRAGKALYGIHKELDDQVRYVIRLASAYLISTGVLHLIAARDPQRNKPIIDATLLIYLLNNAHRIVNRHDAYTAFGMTPARVWGRTAFFSTMGLLMLWGRTQLEDE